MTKAKTLVIGLGVVIAVAGALSLGFCSEIQEGLVDAALKPETPFDPANAPPAPDYGDDANWAALPGKASPATNTPPGVDHSPTAKRAAVFFVHPTTYGYPGAKEGWNQTLGSDSAANKAADALIADGMLRNMASVFNSCCEIHAPRYRQAALYAFIRPTDEAWAAQEIAYEDVLRAFDAFLERIEADEPFILAGHSQGSRHLLQLLEDRVSGTALRERLVAAYLPGWIIPRSFVEARLSDIGVCDAPADTGCLSSWASFGPEGEVDAMRNPTPVRWGEEVRTAEGATPVCVNPLSWRADQAAVAAEDNPGSWLHPVDAAGRPFGEIAFDVTGARCREDGFLIVEPDGGRFDLSATLPGFNYHVYDYPLFHMSVRENAKARVAAWLEAAGR